MLARNFFHTFVYGTVWGAANIYWFPTFMDWMLPFSSTLRKEKKTTPMCALRLMCVSLCSWSIGIKQLPNSKKPFWQGHGFTIIFFWVTSLHHIHYCGVHDTSLVKKPLIWLYFVWSRGLVVCATRKRQNYSFCGHKTHDCEILKFQMVDFCKCVYIF